MTDAPERIWAFYAPDIEEDNPKCNIVAGDQVMHGATEYIHADIHADLVKAADEIYRQLDEVSDVALSHELINMKCAVAIDAALTAYQQAKEKTNAL